MNHERPGITIAICHDDLSLAELHRQVETHDDGIEVQWAYIRPKVVDEAGPAQDPRAYREVFSQVVASATTEAILWIEPGWRFVSPGAGFLAACKEAIRKRPDFVQVKLHSEDDQQFDDRSTYVAIPGEDPAGIRFMIHSPRKLGGGLTLHPAITRTQALRTLGPLLAGAADVTATAAEFCARSTRDGRHLALRAPDLCPFVPADRPRYRHTPFQVEAP